MGLSQGYQLSGIRLVERGRFTKILIVAQDMFLIEMLCLEKGDDIGRSC